MDGYGRLIVALGPMFSSKSTWLVEWARALDAVGDRCLVLKPSHDDRYAKDAVVTHDGVKLPCLTTSTLPHVDDDFDAVLIDEVQFFGIGLVSWVSELLSRGKFVYACGLDMDWRGVPFVVSGSLAAMADVVEKRVANCTTCGREARKTMKKSEEGTSFEVGSSDKYEPRCNDHWSRTALPVVDDLVFAANTED